LNENNYKEIFNYLLNDFLIYREKLLRKSSDFLYHSDIKKIVEDLGNWRIENPNPNEEFAIKFNSVLKKLNLEVDVSNPSSFLNIKHYKENSFIPISSLSTGTKLLISLLLPLYKFETKDSIILIDEPERSLYPDMQMDLMEYYQDFAKEAQFIVATHSPFIAASFEPEERFILYFDENGKVAVRRGKSPIGDDPNDILKNDFDLEFLMNKKGLEAFERFRNLKKQIANENDETIKDNLLTEILELANAYKF
jgi:ABC-type multidrug transport system ATPase subunit